MDLMYAHATNRATAHMSPICLHTIGVQKDGFQRSVSLVARAMLVAILSVGHASAKRTVTGMRAWTVTTMEAVDKTVASAKGWGPSTVRNIQRKMMYARIREEYRTQLQPMMLGRACPSCSWTIDVSLRGVERVVAMDVSGERFVLAIVSFDSVT